MRKKLFLAVFVLVYRWTQFICVHFCGGKESALKKDRITKLAQKVSNSHIIV